jgi:hypothetical protein
MGGVKVAVRASEHMYASESTTCESLLTYHEVTADMTSHDDLPLIIWNVLHLPPSPTSRCTESRDPAIQRGSEQSGP